MERGKSATLQARLVFYFCRNYFATKIIELVMSLR